MFESLDIRIFRSRKKYISLVVNSSTQITVRVPLSVSNSQVQKLLLDKRNWIERSIYKLSKKEENVPVHRFSAGEIFWFLGNSYSLEVSTEFFRGLKFADKFYLSQFYSNQARNIFVSWYKTVALTYFQERVNLLLKNMGVENKPSVAISSAKTRWGSCSSRGRLTFTWRLIMAPPWIIDYVVIHELAHLRHRNHSKTFWLEVNKFCENWKEAKFWLKKEGGRLKI